MQKKLDAITDMNIDFAQWYTDVVKKSEMVDYAPIKGCVIYRPYGFKVWELIQKELDNMFKKVDIENVYMPLFIPQHMLQKEKDHIEGFAPEVALVTSGGDENLEEPLCVRPTSEVLFCHHFSNIIQSYRDLPIKYNQWCSVVRWEKTTRPFLRTTEFLWQEGHTAHETEIEADGVAKQMLDIYTTLFKDVLAIPVVRGRKSEKEKFAGAVTTYTIESIMKDGKALQSATSHNLGNGFGKTFDITFTDKNNNLNYVYQSSWGASTRMIGAVIMVHGDNNGLVLPPKIAPIQVVIVPINQNKDGVLETATNIENSLENFRTKIDVRDKTPGFKFSDWEMKGVPIRIEIGPKDIAENKCVLVTRYSGEKQTVSLENIAKTIEQKLEEINISMYNNAKKSLNEKTHIATTMDEFENILNNDPGFIKAMWCESKVCEEKIKEKTAASTRCLPEEQEKLSDTCIFCGDTAKVMAVFAKSY
ncbi:MAG: proline--tRNA ligase [Defluviitaleaceae bacterium]|nr:proline--tRNA ligase [Defluviitaleaceae bacterium]